MRPIRPIAHLLHGFIGVGKTTFARRLERERPAIRFTHDEWMRRLYGVDPSAASFGDRADRVSAVMETVWTRCLTLGCEVVLDAGFWSRAHRDAVRATVAHHGGRAVLYRIICPDDLARARVVARNQRPHDGLYIAPATYEALRGRVEPLGSDEPCIDVDGRDPFAARPEDD